MATAHKTRMLIIGSGPAGLSAAIYGARAGMEPIVVQGLQPGGQLTITTDVENYPGFREVIQGPWLMQEMEAQAVHVGTRMMYDIITSVDLSGPTFVATGDSGDTYEGETLVIATGAQARWLGVPGEQELSGKGVSACATCDGFFYRGKKVVVIGGGNTAVEEALYLTNHSDDVTLIHRRDSLRSEKILQDRLFANPKISVIWNKKVDRFMPGENGELRALALTDTVTGEQSEIVTDGAFVAIGHAPATELFKGKLAMDDTGYLLVEAGTPKTAIPGVYAAGDVSDHVYRQAITAAGAGCMAALDAERYLAEREFERLKAEVAA
ncbi:thioredoxin-disulfide reductase [Novosphingobium colocasiae]|uniref:Thioredoxin reductase n=1 Tax=Novosphingobium colocasiae TaxID=1256513 RepID=A0A918PIJ0_9SPHN|nr:thioredoxin-disulfide reductase [Novosphingobium colocasiae]GGZ08557.1 thioredoxin reductase [Novosphingobium colocasiae]